MLQSEVDAHTNHPVLRLRWDQIDHDLRDVVVQVEEATEEPAKAGESSRSHAVVTTNVSQDDVLYT